MSGGWRMHFGEDVKIKVKIVLITKNRGAPSEAERSVVIFSILVLYLYRGQGTRKQDYCTTGRVRYLVLEHYLVE
jgi:hypothetical protein